MANAVEILFSTPNFRDVQQTIGSVGASLDKLARAGQSASERQARASAKGFSDTAKAAERAAKEAAKAQEKEAREATRAIEKAEKDKTRAIDRETKEALRIRNAGNRQALIDWKRDLREQSSAHEKALKDSETRAKAFGRAGGSAVSRALGTAGKIAATAAAIGGGFTVADALGKGIANETTSGIIYRGAANKGGFGSQKEVKDLATATAISTGGTTEDILSGLDQFVRKTGDLGAAKVMLEDMAKMSAATGANFADMGNTAAEIQNQLEDPKKTLEVMRALLGQGMAGAIDIKDLGQYGGRLAASAAQYSGDLSGNIESFGAIAQLSKKLGGATDTAEATESVARLGSDFAKHEYGFNQLGVNVFSDKSKTKFRSAEDVITETVSKSKGDITVLKELFGERSIKAALGAQVAYANAGGGQAGEEAIRSLLKSLKSNTPTQAAIDKGAAEAMEERQRKINVALEKLGKVFDEQLGPLIPKLVEKLIELIPAIERMLKFFTNQSAWVGVGALVGAALVAELTTAAIGVGVEAALVSIIKAITIPAAASSVASVVGTAGASASTALAGGATGGLAGAAGIAEGAAAGAGAGAGTGILAAGGMALAGIGAVVGIGGGIIYGLGKIAEKRGEKKVSDVIAANASTPEEQKNKLDEMQDLMARSAEQEAAFKKHRNAAGAIVDTDTITPAEAKAMGDSEAAAAAKQMDLMRTTVEQLQQSLQKMNETVKEIAAIEPPPGNKPTEPGHPYRGAAAD